MLLLVMSPHLVVLAHQVIIDYDAIVGIGTSRLEFRIGILLVLAGIILLEYVLSLHRLHDQSMAVTVVLALAVKEVVHIAELQGTVLIAFTLIRGLWKLLLLLLLLVAFGATQSQGFVLGSGAGNLFVQLSMLLLLILRLTTSHGAHTLRLRWLLNVNLNGLHDFHAGFGSIAAPVLLRLLLLMLLMLLMLLRLLLQWRLLWTHSVDILILISIQFGAGQAVLSFALLQRGTGVMRLGQCTIAILLQTPLQVIPIAHLLQIWSRHQVAVLPQ